MKNLRDIKNNFYAQFNNLAQNRATIPFVPLALPFDDFLIAKWQSEPLKKILRLQEMEEDDTLGFGYALGRAGLEWQYHDLLIITQFANEKVALAFEIYQLWFEQNKSPSEMEEILGRPYAEKWFILSKKIFYI